MRFFLYSTALAMGLFCLAAFADDTAPVTIKVTGKTATTQPVSPLLFSSFLELAFGRSDLISAELLFDRGFEIAAKETLNSGNGWAQRVKDKIEDEDWWHSGYEENRWRLIKADDDKDSSFKRLGDTWPAPPNGKHYARLENKSKTAPIALAQDGVWLRAGVEYDFTGLLCDGTMFSAEDLSKNPVEIEIALYPENKLTEKPLTQTTISVNATTCRKFSAKLPAPETTGRATFVLRVPAGRKLVCDNLSLMPADRVGAFRKEVVAAMKNDVPASVIRFPGGCFASTYHWRDGIGDRDSRPIDFQHWWTVPHQNDIGTVEFLKLCKEIGSEPMMCVPVMFDDALNAADWVAFCNTPSHPLHAKAGIAQSPMRVKYWELDNETYRRMDAITYAHKVVEFSRAMKKVDPEIKILMNAYWVYHGKLKEMLDIAGSDIDLVNNRGGNIAELKSDLAVLAEYNSAHQRDIGLCHTEYRANSYDLPSDGVAADAVEGGLNVPKKKDEKDSSVAKASRWSYGLSILCDFLEYQKFGGAFRFANFTGYNDGWGEGLINCSKSHVYPSAAGQAFAFLHNQHMAWPLESTGSAPQLRTQAAWDSEKKTLILFALNLSDHPRPIVFDVSNLDSDLQHNATMQTLWSKATRVSVKESENPILSTSSTLTHDGRNVRLTLQPFSVSAIRVDRAK